MGNSNVVYVDSNKLVNGYLGMIDALFTVLPRWQSLHPFFGIKLNSYEEYTGRSIGHFNVYWL
jgi:hypothetical protein